MKLIISILFLANTCFADWQPDDQMCDEMSKDIEHFYVQLDPYSDDAGEFICYNSEEMLKRKYPNSKLSPKRQHTAKGIIESLCIDFELASCVNYTELNKQ